MPVVSMKELLEAGVHFGHQTRRWNPKMKRFIFTERGGIYIIDLTKTQELLDEAHNFARNIAERNGTILFVGTKKQAQDAVESQAKRVGMPYVNHRWLGGLLTNWRTMADRIDRLHEMRRLRDEGQLELLPAKERKRHEREGLEARRRTDRRARTRTLDLALAVAELWLRDMLCVCEGAPELIHAVDRRSQLEQDAREHGDPGVLRDALELVADTRMRLALNVSEELALEALAYRLAALTQ